MGPKTTLKRLYAEFADEETPGGDRVEFVFHTYDGFLVFATQREHRFRLPPDRARELLWRLHKFILTWGLLAYGVLLIPLLSYGNYLAQKSRIRKQERLIRPNKLLHLTRRIMLGFSIQRFTCRRAGDLLRSSKDGILHATTILACSSNSYGLHVYGLQQSRYRATSRSATG